MLEKLFCPYFADSFKETNFLYLFCSALYRNPQNKENTTNGGVMAAYSSLNNGEIHFNNILAYI